ncbi:MAG: RNA-protein complex protein Nop10 [Thermoplasmata archaeon]|nr:RNA-protein complex protein Nop10 [Thermoplasmata archaeon]MCI4359449.1 RNA-protein complex protein Nop10 [Thermoplasmata archaeon]
MNESILRFCLACQRYSLDVSCPSCGASTRSPHPARFSPQDRWGKYRRALMAEARAAPGGA